MKSIEEKFLSNPETKRHLDQTKLCVGSRGEREFPFSVIPGNTSLKFPFPSHGICNFPSRSQKRKFRPGITTGNTIIINIVLGTDIKPIVLLDKVLILTIYFYFFPIPVFLNSRNYKPQISLPVKRECDFQCPFPFPGAKKPFPLTPKRNKFKIS